MLFTPKSQGIFAALLLVTSMSTAQAQRSEAETRLRDMLRETTIQLRDAQSQNAELRSQLDELKARSAAMAPPKPTASVDFAALSRVQREASQLRSQLVELRQALDERDSALAQWKEAYGQAEQTARTRDADAKQFDQERQTLGTRVQACERDNAQLVGIAEEILGRYRNKSVWDAVRDNEPLTGLSRVKLETLAQQYHSKIVDLKAPATAEPPAQQAQ